MTEAEWLTGTDPQKMLVWLQVSGAPSDRKLRLFVCACCRRIWHLLPDERSRKAVEVAERFADTQADAGQLEAARVAVWDVSETPVSRWGAAWGAVCDDALEGAWEGLREAAGWGDTSKVEQSEEAPLLRDIFGNPFRPFILNVTWVTPAVTALAQTIYDQRCFQDLPILADALEEAGCTNADILDHLRGPGPHVRGCWAVDLILGKE
ncbi:MAG TPA: hypothetical protein VEL76_08820 [Gemmataceae bacterium]|nr:hypothetical protein [Gemmataceae bacterium]